MSGASRPADLEASGRYLFLLALVAGALLRFVLLGNPDLFGSDEGAFAVGARNLVEGGWSQFLGLGRTPLGEPSGTPIFLPLILSVMVRVFGPVEWAIRLPSAGLGLLGALVLERIVRRGYGQPAGHLAGAFAALFPPLVAASRMAAVQPTLVALGLGGLIFGIRALEEDSPAEAVLSGGLFGLGFLCDGEAVGLYFLPLAVAILLKPAILGLGRSKRSLVLFVATFLLVGGSHLLLVLAVRPALASVEIAGAFGGAPPALGGEPTAFGADLKTIVGQLFLFLPLAGVGVASLFRGVSEDQIASGATGGERRLSHDGLWAAAFLELLVVVAVAGRLKLSSIPVMPALAAFTGLGAAAILSPSGDRKRSETTIALVSGVLIAGAALVLMSAPDDPLFGGLHPTAAAALASIGVATAGVALLSAGVGRARLGGRLAPAFLVALLTASGLASLRMIRHDLLAHRTGSRELADQIAPAVAALVPADVAFRAPEPEAVAFHLFRTGRSWRGVPSAEVLPKEPRTVRCWAYREHDVPGPTAPPADVKDWLAANAREVTAEVDARFGGGTGLRVFVPR